MAASVETVRAILEIVRRHCSDAQVERILNDLHDVPGNKSFRETISKLISEARQ